MRIWIRKIRLQWIEIDHENALPHPYTRIYTFLEKYDRDELPNIFPEGIFPRTWKLIIYYLVKGIEEQLEPVHVNPLLFDNHHGDINYLELRNGPRVLFYLLSVALNSKPVHVINQEPYDDLLGHVWAPYAIFTSIIIYLLKQKNQQPVIFQQLPDSTQIDFRNIILFCATNFIETEDLASIKRSCQLLALDSTSVTNVKLFKDFVDHAFYIFRQEQEKLYFKNCLRTLLQQQLNNRPLAANVITQKMALYDVARHFQAS